MANTYTRHGEKKINRTLGLTDTANSALTQWADAAKVSRSEFLERLLKNLDELNASQVEKLMER